MKTLDLSRTVRGRTVPITGTASGIGRAAAHVFAADGARVPLVTALGIAIVFDRWNTGGEGRRRREGPDRRRRLRL
jgi:3-oxoacyl-[acyl-carrier protein] reductase